MFGFRRHRSNPTPGAADAAEALWARTIVDIPAPRRGLAAMSAEPAEREGTSQISLAEEKFKIRFASTPDRRESASLLVKKMYAWRGYATDDGASQQEANRITLVASYQERVIGTLTIGFDSPAGLLADQMYKEEVDRLRAEGRRVGEFIKLAADRDIHSMRVLAALFHLAYIYGRKIHQYTDAVIEVNPRHVGFYEKILGFRQIGPERICPRARAPAVLLSLSADYVAEKIRQFGGQREKAHGERSLYPWFFSPEEEEGITRRLLAGR
jgi:hypothetical protein